MPFGGFSCYFSGLFPDIPKTQKRKEGLKMNYRKTFNHITLIAWSTIAVIFIIITMTLMMGVSASVMAEPLVITLGDFSGSETVIDFNAISNTHPITDQYTASGVDFSGALVGLKQTGNCKFNGSTVASNWISGPVNWPGYGNQGASWEAKFDDVYHRVGFFFSTNNGDSVTIEAFLGAVSIGSLNFPSPDGVEFLGLGDAGGFDRIRVITAINDSGFFAMDDFRMEYGLYRVQNSDNGHWYHRFDNSMTWHDAKAHCESMDGYLSTITSQQEHDFLYNNLGSVSPNDCWLGGTDEMVEGEWNWINGENWDYTLWKAGEPNNCAGDEQYLMLLTPNSWKVKHRANAGLWNDTATGNNGGCGCNGCNELWPMSTICEWDSVVIYNPDNGHYYQLVEVQGPGLNWYEANDAAEVMEHKGIRGHLATFTSPDEEEFMVRNFPQVVPNYVWLGAADKGQEGDWKWITGEPWSYSNWDPNEPNGGTFENCMDYADGFDKWNDEHCERQLNFYLVEYAYMYLVEAESGALSPPMQVIGDGCASGAAIWTRPKYTSKPSPPASGRAVYTFNVQTAGIYRIKGSVIAPDTAHDSFWVKVDSENWVKWNDIPLSTDWHTAYVHDYDNDNTVVEYDLSTGAHTLTIAYREGGTKLDTIALELVVLGVANYPFDGNANDESGNGNDGTVFGANLATDRFGEPNNAYSFDGVDDYIEVLSFNALTFNKITVSTWVNTVPGNINNHRIVTIHDGIDPEHHHFDIESNSGRGLDVYIDGEAVGEFDWQFEPNTWTHITVSWDGNNVRIYKDAMLTETGIRSVDPRTGTLYIGGVDSPHYGAQIWDGEIDDIHIYNRVLSEAEIKVLYNLGK